MKVLKNVVFAGRTGSRNMNERFETDFSNRPRLLLAYVDGAFASECGRFFRRLGWEVQFVTSGMEAIELTREWQPNVVALEESLADISGWLTSAKLNIEHADLHIVMVASETHQISEDHLRAVGASESTSRREGAEGLANAVLGYSTLAKAV